jgi:hypothetical protein
VLAAPIHITVRRSSVSAHKYQGMGQPVSRDSAFRRGDGRGGAIAALLDAVGTDVFRVQRGPAVRTQLTVVGTAAGSRSNTSFT